VRRVTCWEPRPYRKVSSVLALRLKATLLLGAAAAVLLFALAGASPAGAATAAKKCSSFGSQKAAQKYFVRKGGSQSDDVGGLDPDGDGLVCPMNPAPFAAYVEIGYAHGFFYGSVVCVYDPLNKNEEEAKQCASGLIEVELKRAKPGKDPTVASHKAEVGEYTTLPAGASEKKVKRIVYPFEWKLEPKNAHGTFYAVSEECYGTTSRHLTP
jgi:hypothetical protein